MNLKSQISNLKSHPGRRYWRSLEEAAGTPEFRRWLGREFPEGATELPDAVSRRHFLKIMSASFALAGLGVAGAGCRRPVERLEPFGKQPEGYVYGTSQYYATARPSRDGAVPLLARAYEGRPVKLEGNPEAPGGNSGTDRWTQASILDLYDPDRARRFTKGGTNVAAEAAYDFLSELSRRAQASGGEGLFFLVESSPSPSRLRLQQVIRRRFPKALWFVHDAVALDQHRRSAQAVFGKPVLPVYRYEAARVILSLDSDFLGSEEDVRQNIRRFVQGRRIATPEDDLNRLYVIESLMTLTGMAADHRMRVPGRGVLRAAAALGREVLGWSAARMPEGIDGRWLSGCARDLLNHRGESLVVAGYRQPNAVHILAHAMNSALGNIGKTVEFREVPAETSHGGLGQLAKYLAAREVDTLVILGANPVYSADRALGWAKAQRRAKTVVRLGYYEDETFAVCDWHMPAAHYLESWGDARTYDGTVVSIQPLIAPLFGGLTELEVLARVAGESVTSPYEIVRATFAELSPGADENAWRKFLYRGFVERAPAPPVWVELNSAMVQQELANVAPGPTPGKESLDVVFHRDYKLDDGRYWNNGWLQELPDPVTKLAWDNAVVMSRHTARDLGLRNNDVVEVRLRDRAITGPVWIQPGMADWTLGLALGYGRQTTGRVGAGAGFDASALRADGEYLAVGAQVRSAGRTFPLAVTQNHWSMEGRPIVREANLDQYREHPDFAMHLQLEEPEPVAPLYPNPLKQIEPKAHHQWGMAIDLNLCVGCTACVVACQSENNIPIVGKDQVRRGREMLWLRIDRYYAADPTGLQMLKTDREQQDEEWIDNPQVVLQPMLCQHCEAAPCENVCPVNATVHDQEGLNVMVYNRCVGTRYCSNNCPYKVRRFNYLDYNKRPLGELKGPFYSTPLLHRTEGQWDLWRWLKNPADPTNGMRPGDEWDLLKMAKNPDVTVRMRGIMEKCTFCIQRIEQAKIAQKVKAGASGEVKLREAEGTVPQTACQQACPGGAIVFGDISDPNSRVSQLKKQQRNYVVLDSLYTRPRTTYLARVRNPNASMPDYRVVPLSQEEFIERTAPAPGHTGEPPAGVGRGQPHG